jgi:hypothetical protein
MIAASTPDFARDFPLPNEALPSLDASTATSETAATAENGPPGFSDAHARIEEIEQLYTAGYTTYQIAERLNLRPRDVGRNLRETRKRYQRAARRQTEILAVGQCAAIHSEAMEGWRRSQESKLAITTRRKNGEEDTVTTRAENRPGNATFLNTALRAVKQLRQIAAEAPAAPRKASDAVRLALLDVLTPKQFATLDPDQLQSFRTSLDRWRTILSAADDEMRAAGAPAHESAAAEPPVQMQVTPVSVADESTPDIQSGPLEAEATTAGNAGASDDAAKKEQAPLAARNGGQATSRKTSRGPRHPEWPAESFLTRTWLPRDHCFAANGRENGARPAETAHERNGCNRPHSAS